MGLGLFLLFQMTRLKMEHEERLKGMLPGEMKRVGFH